MSVKSESVLSYPLRLLLAVAAPIAGAFVIERFLVLVPELLVR